MRFFLWLLTLFAAAIGLAVLARFNPGNVVFFYPPYRVDLSLNLFLVLTALLFVLVYVVLKAIRVARLLPLQVAAYRREKREREGNRALREALKALLEGRFGHAEKAATRALESPDNAGLAALVGAQAAHRMTQADRRDAWLARVAEEPALKTARLMTTLDLMVDDHRHEAANEAVKELNATGTRHIHALRLSLKASQQSRNWPEVLRLVRSLDKHNALHPMLSRRLRELAYEELLGDKSHDAESLRRVWAEVPTKDRTPPVIAACAAAAFHARGLNEEARAIVEKALANEWDERLVRAYRLSAAPEGSPDLLAQIERCESWLAIHPNDADLALTLGVLCMRQKLWGKAQNFLERALKDAATPSTLREAHLQLAQMHEALGQQELAQSHYRQCALMGAAN